MSAPRDLRLTCFPSADHAFREDVVRAAEDLPEDAPDSVRRDRLVASLRPWYRKVEIVFQDELAHFELQPIHTWYVYRDGRVRRADERRERLYAALASARRTINASRSALDDARVLVRAAGYREDGPARFADAERDPDDVAEPASDSSEARATSSV
jgi:hypothetical protein